MKWVKQKCSKRVRIYPLFLGQAAYLVTLYDSIQLPSGPTLRPDYSIGLTQHLIRQKHNHHKREENQFIFDIRCQCLDALFRTGRSAEKSEDLVSLSERKTSSFLTFAVHVRTHFSLQESILESPPRREHTTVQTLLFRRQLSIISSILA